MKVHRIEIEYKADKDHNDYFITHENVSFNVKNNCFSINENDKRIAKFYKVDLLSLSSDFMHFKGYSKKERNVFSKEVSIIVTIKKLYVKTEMKLIKKADIS